MSPPPREGEALQNPLSSQGADCRNQKHLFHLAQKVIYQEPRYVLNVILWAREFQPPARC